MSLHESKAAATRSRREATRKFLDDQAYEVHHLRDQNAGHKMMNPTIDKLEAVLAARHPTEFRYESFAYLSGRSPGTRMRRSGPRIRSTRAAAAAACGPRATGECGAQSGLPRP